MSEFTPREIVAELDRHIIGQHEAKRAVAIALRNRWRRRQLGQQLREEVHPHNILMIGPTGVGKTEIARRLAKLANAPFVKVEATKFTEVGYVGRDVDTIIRDLVEAAIHLLREQRRADNRTRAELSAEERVLNALVGADASETTRQSFRRKLRSGELNDRELEIDIADAGPAMPDLGMMGGNVAAIDLSAVLSKALGGRGRKRKMTVAQSHQILLAEEADKLIDMDSLHRDAITLAENDGIVFIDEIDKICARAERSGADVSREGVQRDLLPLIEGSVVNTRHGPARTDHILFICSGAFHIAQPSDLLPELQGRLPVRVELKPLTKPDFICILTETDNNLCKQASALLATEQVQVQFQPDGVDALAELADAVNTTVENIGARRLHTIMEKVMEEISFDAPDRAGSTVSIDRAYVEARVGSIARDRDLSRYIL